MTIETGPLKQRPQRKRSWSRMLLTIVVLYVLLCVAGCALQRKLMYFPTKLSPTVAEQAAAKEGVTPWKNAKGKIVGWRMATNGSATGSALVVHGNGGCALNRSYFAEPIHAAANVDVYVLEYPGYGAREGSPSMKTCLAAVDEAFDLLPKDLPKYVVSESLGTGIAAHLARSHSNAVSGFAMFVPYDDLLPLAKTCMRFLPVGLILLDRYEPAAWLADYRGPIKFVVAQDDEVIPARFGLKLHEGYQGPKALELIPGAHHNEISAQDVSWWRETFRFWQEHRKS